MGSVIKKLSVILLIAITFVMISCKDKITDPPLSSNDFNGMVKDESGNPISGVSVYIIPDETLAALNGKSYFTNYLQTVLDTLPVELTSFSVSTIGNNITLNWATATENNVDGYSIQKSLYATLPTWTNIGFVAGSGNSNSPKNYLFTEKNVETGHKYLYRLKMLKLDGSFLYSQNVEADVFTPSMNELSQCYPNPFNGTTTTIRYALQGESKISLKILNCKKSVVKRILIDDFANSVSTHQAGNYSYTFRVTSTLLLGNGIYTIQLLMQNQSTGKTDTLYKLMVKVELDLFSLINMETNSVVANDGKFTIPYDDFNLDSTYVLTGPDSPEPLSLRKFTNTPTLVLMKSGYQTIQQKINVDDLNNPEQTFILKKAK